MRDALALGVADDALAVAAELRVVAGQQHQSGQHPGAELLEHRAVAPVAVDLPVRRHRAEVHDASVGSRGLRLDDVGHGDSTGRFGATRSAARRCWTHCITDRVTIRRQHRDVAVESLTIRISEVREPARASQRQYQTTPTAATRRPDPSH